MELNKTSGFLIVMVAMAFILFVIVYKLDEGHFISREQVRTEIRSIKVDSNVSGSFRLGTGKIDTDDYYYFFIGDSASGFELDKVKTKDAVIAYTEDDPYITFEAEYYSNILCDTIVKRTGKFTICIPPESIIENYELK